MTRIVREKNFLVVEGRLISAGKRSHLTASEWLYLYEQIKPHLLGAQKEVFLGIAKRIQKRFPNLATQDNTAE